MAQAKSNLEEIATSFLAAFKHLSIRDHLALRTETCTHIFAPSSLNPPAPKSNEAFAQHLSRNLQPLLVQFPVNAKEIHINESGRQITIWATGKPEFKPEAKGKDSMEEEWVCTNEYIFILDVDENGKIVRIMEFLDSLVTERLRGLLTRAKRNAGIENEVAF